MWKIVMAWRYNDEDHLNFFKVYNFWNLQIND